MDSASSFSAYFEENEIVSYRLDIKKGFRGKWQYHETYSGQGSKELAKADEKFMQKKGYRTRIKKY